MGNRANRRVDVADFRRVASGSTINTRRDLMVALVTPIPLSTVSARVRRISRSVASHATSKHPCMRGEIHE